MTRATKMLERLCKKSGVTRPQLCSCAMKCLTNGTIMSGRLKHASNSIIFSSSRNAQHIRDVILAWSITVQYSVGFVGPSRAGPGFRQYRLLDRFHRLSVDNTNLVRV